MSGELLSTLGRYDLAGLPTSLISIDSDHPHTNNDNVDSHVDNSLSLAQV